MVKKIQRCRPSWNIACLTIYLFLFSLTSEGSCQETSSASEAASPAPERIPATVLPHPDEWPLLEDGIIEALEFHEELVSPKDGLPAPALSLASAARSFLDFAHRALAARGRNAPSPAFRLTDEDFLRLLEGVLDPHVAAFTAFSGKWFGLWEGHPVDHDWSETAAFDPPVSLSRPPLHLHALQYAWIGDGFGWNIVVSRRDRPEARFILGTVFHVRDKDRKQVYLRRPHAGIASDPSTLIWITRQEVFFEEVPGAPAERQSYCIHGFFYERTGTTLRFPRGGFSATYTRDPGNRPDWLALPFDPAKRARDP